MHRDDEWEESEEAWELGEEEMMIVGTVQQEESYSWQDASRSWLEKDEGEEVGIYQVEARQGANESPVGEGKEGITCPPGKARGGAEAAEDDCWASFKLTTLCSRFLFYTAAILKFT